MVWVKAGLGSYGSGCGLVGEPDAERGVQVGLVGGARVAEGGCGVVVAVCNRHDASLLAWHLRGQRLNGVAFRW